MAKKKAAKKTVVKSARVLTSELKQCVVVNKAQAKELAELRRQSEQVKALERKWAKRAVESEEQYEKLCAQCAKDKEVARQRERDLGQQIRGMKQAVAVLGGRDNSAFVDSLERMCETVVRHAQEY